MCLLTEQNLTNYYSLFFFINRIKNVIKIYTQALWVVAEISELKQYNNHLFLTLVEYDAQGNLLARARSVIWNCASILKGFFVATNIELKIGIKILALISADYHLQYGLTLVINKLDPSYTLGDAQAKVLKIKQQLTQEGILNNNKLLQIPLYINNIAVISPQNAAGLGDFKKEALILQNNNICNFDYYTAIFQGIDASLSITNVLYKISSLSKKYDVIVIIRGGGASSDLTWLNDYAIAKAICLLDIPVLSGIGHNKDQTIIDQVANQSFDTPSKVINFFITRLINYTTQIYSDINYIKQYCDNFYSNINNNLKCFSENIKTHGFYIIEKINKNLDQELKLQPIIFQYLNNLNKLLDATWQQILCFSPELTLSKGFALVYGNNNKVLVTSKAQASQYSQLIIKFQDGEIECVNASQINTDI